MENESNLTILQKIDYLLVGFDELFIRDSWNYEWQEVLPYILKFLMKLRNERIVKGKPAQIEFIGLWNIIIKDIDSNTVGGKVYSFWHKICKYRMTNINDFEWATLGIIEGFLYNLLLEGYLEGFD